MEISHPRRILMLASPSVELTTIINTLVPPPSKPGPSSTKQDPVSKNSESTDVPVNADGQPLHHIKTPYYSARVPIWTDRIESSAAWCTEWKQQDGAGEVVRAVGAWIVAFAKPSSPEEEESTKNFITHVSEVLDHHSGPGSSYDYTEDAGDAVRLAVALPATAASNHAFDLQAWEDTCQESGAWELIDAEASGVKNQYGETTGLKRLLEALTAAEWDAGEEDLEAMLGLDGEDEDEGSDAGEPETAEMREPILAPQKAGKAEKDGKGDKEGEEGKDGTEEDVEELQRMMVRLQAARDMGADLPIAERRKLAAKAVREVMRG